MLTTIRYILLTAIRDRLFLGLLFGVAAAAYISSILGGTAMLEPEQMTLAFTAASSRIIVMIGIIVFIGFSIRNAFDTREMDMMVSRPMSRLQLVLSFAAGFGLVALLLVLPVLALIYLMGALSETGFWVYAASLISEAWMVAAIALFCALTIKSGAVSVLSALAIYTISRLVGYFLATTNSTAVHDSGILALSSWMIEGVSMIIPRLDFFAKSEWLIYGPRSIEDATLFLYQAVIFIPLLLAACAIDFTRKEF